MTQALVLRQIDERGVATLTLNRPEVNNAYNGDMIAELAAGVTALAADRRTRIVVLRGNGKHFQAGADLRWLQDIAALDAVANLDVSRLTARALRDLNQLPLPTIALIHGGCFGGGTGMAAACDIVIASRDAQFAISEARWGVVAGIIFPQLIGAIGLRNVRRYTLSCERFDASKALALGLVHEVCETGKLDEAAAPVIDSLLLAGPEAVAYSKKACLELAGAWIDDVVLERLAVEHSNKRQSAEAAEGLRSFVEKRKPKWYPG
ncbi:MAG: enoyl-CoA hydratase-related protein [Gammaproteobacteria bacterium]